MVGKNIKRIRTSKGLTQEELDKFGEGIPTRTLQDIEEGRTNPTLKSLYRIADILKVDITSFFNTKKNDEE